MTAATIPQIHDLPDNVEAIEARLQEAVDKKWNACTAHMRDVPWLIAEIKRLRAENVQRTQPGATTDDSRV